MLMVIVISIDFATASCIFSLIRNLIYNKQPPDGSCLHKIPLKFFTPTIDKEPLFIILLVFSVVINKHRNSNRADDDISYKAPYIRQL